MILYFADRRLNIIGQASTKLPKGLKIVDDLKSEDVDTGVSSFECTLSFSNLKKEERKKVTTAAAVGNYILKQSDDGNKADEFYTIIEYEENTKDQIVTVYAEDAGLDLLNEVVGAFVADKAYPIDYYINKFAYDSGFVIGLNEVADLSRTLSWDGESTVTERLNSVATQFDCELSYSFDIEKFKIKAKYINIHKKRGKDIGDTVHLNKSVDKIVTTKSIANLATALRVTGGTPEPEEPAEGEEYVEPAQITLDGYKYDDGDIFLEGTYLKSRKAAEVWSRYLAEAGDYTGHICKPFNYDTVSQEELCNRAIAELKKVREVEVNYEIDITKLPATAKLGDRINVVDDDGELYLSARILKLEVSETDGTKKAVIGEYLIKNDGISQTVYNLSQRFAVIAQENIKALNAAKAAQKEAESAKQIATNAESTANSAKSAAEISKEAAEMAEQAAANAEVRATEAHNASLEAQRQATIAEQAAGTATEKAESALSNSTEAQTVAGQAKEEAKTAKDTADAAKLDAEQAEKDIAALGENLESLSSTMSADYARKTDLTETEASLQSQITQNATQIQSTVTKVTEIDETANNAAEQASQAQQTAANAQNVANQATVDAEAAQQAATAANNAASSAQSEADKAKAAAAEAQSIADKAESDLEDAKAELAAVKGRVDATEAEIAAAEQSVSNAQAAADKAKADAAAAQSTADAAESNAAKAQAAANNAQTAANNAQTAANEAKAAADNAQAAADALAVRVVKAETDIVQTAEQIKLLATREEVTQTLGGYYTKEQTESRIEETAEEINLSVSAVREEVDNINIGGRNLILGTGTAEGWSQYTSFNKETREFTKSSTSTSESYIYGGNTFSLEHGQTYTLSFWAKQNGNLKTASNDVYILPRTFNTTGIAYNPKIENITTEYKKYVFTFIPNPNATSLADCQIRFDNDGSVADGTEAILYIKDVKLEKGNKATDWTPAPEDMATAEEMGLLADRVTDAETAISQNADAIELRATKTEVTNAVDAVNVGGRNLVPNTTLDTVYSGNKGSSTYKDVWAEVTIGIPEGTEYVVSFDAKADEAQTIKCFFYNPNTTLTSESSTGQKRENVADGTSQVNITTEWKRYWVKWTQTPATARKAIIVGRCESASTVYIRAVKLEEGNKPTSWTPAPEDYMTATQTKAAIKVEADKISSVVETTNGHETRLSAVEQTANGLTISLNQTNENVTTAQTTANNAATAASNAQSTANTANSTANTAKNNAATAQNTANSAASAASTAQTTANNAASAAATAQSTANTANTNATNAAKTATNFLEYTSSGLMIGNKTSGSWSGCRTQITSSAFNILNSSGNQLASFSYNSSEGFTQLTSPTGVLITNGMLARYSGTSGSSSLQSIVSVSSNQATLRATTYNSGGSISANAYLILSSGGADLYGTSSIRITAPTIALEGDVGVEGAVNTIDSITIDPGGTSFVPFISKRKISSTTYRADFGVGNPTTGNAAAMIRLTNSGGGTVHNLFYLHSSNASILYGSFQAGSDRRLKADISYDFSKFNAVFDNLKPASYKLVKDEQGLLRIGFIAQDVQDAFTAAGYDPEKFGIVSRQDEYLTLAYDEIIPLLVAKVQNMAAEIEELKGTKTA